jgi:hypothetical protein
MSPRRQARAHRRDRVRLAGQDVTLLEPALGGKVEVAAAVRADGTGLLALDVALQPGGVDRLDEEFLADVEGQGVAEPLCVVVGTFVRSGAGDPGPKTGTVNLPPAARVRRPTGAAPPGRDAGII